MTSVPNCSKSNFIYCNQALAMIDIAHAARQCYECSGTTCDGTARTCVNSLSLCQVRPCFVLNPPRFTSELVNFCIESDHYNGRSGCLCQGLRGLVCRRIYSSLWADQNSVQVLWRWPVQRLEQCVQFRLG